MKSILSVFFIFLLSACSHYQSTSNSAATSSQYANDVFTRTGPISAEELVTRYKKFAQSYQQFTPEKQDTFNMTKLKGMDFIVFFGLWCHDSQREVSRLIKLLENSGHDLKHLKLVAIDTQKTMPTEYASRFDVKFTPTIFVLKDGQTLAKVIEKPKQSLAKDIASQIFH